MRESTSRARLRNLSERPNRKEGVKPHGYQESKEDGKKDR
jgi:hypothetical protein